MIKCFNITAKVISHNEAMKSDGHFTTTDSDLTAYSQIIVSHWPINVYCTIDERLLRLCGVQRDKKQVTAKLKSLKSFYQKTKDHNNMSGRTVK